MRSKNAVEANATTANQTVAVILPSRLQPGQRVSGSLVTDPDRFAGNPDLLLTRVTLPLPSSGSASRFGGWTLELKGSAPQPADAPISFVVPAAGPLAFTLRQADDPSVAVSGVIDLPKTATPKWSATPDFESSALCFKQDVCTVAGPFNGNASTSFVSFDKVPAPILAQTQSVAYIDVPPSVPGGSSTLIVAAGNKIAAMVMVVASLSLEPTSEAVQPGQTAGGAVRLDSVAELADAQWRYGVFPPGNLERARALVPGFNPPKVIHQEHEQLEKQEKQDGNRKPEDKKEESAGMLLVVVRNLTPDVATLRAATQQSYVFHLIPDSFSMGDFKYGFAADPLKAGTLSLRATAIPFLAPVKAQIFDADATTAKK